MNTASEQAYPTTDRAVAAAGGLDAERSARASAAASAPSARDPSTRTREAHRVRAIGSEAAMSAVRGKRRGPALGPVRWSFSSAIVLAVMITGLAVIASLLFASSSMAWRPPVGREARAITQAAKKTRTAYPNKTVHVSGIRVSTVGPWASATITIYIRRSPNSATDILHKVGRRWVNVDAGTSEEQCVMPVKDQRNLGFSEGC